VTGGTAGLKMVMRKGDVIFTYINNQDENLHNIARLVVDDVVGTVGAAMYGYVW
jgi:hypothetical protein